MYEALTHADNSCSLMSDQSQDSKRMLNVPNRIVIMLRYVEGATFLSMMLLGTSDKMYGTQNRDKAMLN